MAYDLVLLALSDPTRRRVFEALAGRSQAVVELASGLPVSRPAVSQHLKVLSDAGLVSVEVKGTRRIYAVRPEGIAELRAWLDRHWDLALARFAEEARKSMESRDD